MKAKLINFIEAIIFAPIIFLVFLFGEILSFFIKNYITKKEAIYHTLTAYEIVRLEQLKEIYGELEKALQVMSVSWFEGIKFNNDAED